MLVVLNSSAATLSSGDSKKTTMLFLVDIGNSQTTMGLYAHDGLGGSYQATWRVRSNADDTADSICIMLHSLLDMTSFSKWSIHQVCMASVVPSLSAAWTSAVKKAWGADGILCSSDLAIRLGLFDADYPSVQEIGSDRVADAIAARELYGAPVIVVDFGTATNIEVIDSCGKFIGGAIAPGVMTSASALFSKTALIPSTDLQAPESAIGKSTAEAVRAGVMYGEAGRVDGIVERMLEEIGSSCPVVATGGFVHTISKLCRHVTNVCPELTLDGLRILADAYDDKGCTSTG